MIVAGRVSALREIFDEDRPTLDFWTRGQIGVVTRSLCFILPGI